MPDLPEVALPIAGAVLAALVVFVLIRTVAGLRLRPLEGVFDPGSARRRGLLLPYLEGTVRGVPVRYNLEPKSNHSPGGAEVRCAVDSPVYWHLQRRGPRQRLLATLGVVRPVPTGLADLDERFMLIASDGRESPLTRCRAELEPLVGDRAFAGLKVDRRGLTARWSPQTEADLAPAEVRGRFDHVLRVLEALGYPPKMS